MSVEDYLEVMETKMRGGIFSLVVLYVVNSAKAVSYTHLTLPTTPYV